MRKYILIAIFMVLPLAACAENTTVTQSDGATVAPSTAIPSVLPSTSPNAPDNSDQAAALIDSFSTQPSSGGVVLILFGQVLDVDGTPIPNAVVEIWQTDANGVYDHPGDPGTEGRDLSFQFFGSAKTDSDGWYVFRTIMPGRYEPRPRHIHYKVKQGNRVLLTSQFYFSDDIAEVEGEGMFRAVGDSSDLLLLQLVQGDDAILANGRIVVDSGIGSGALPLTPSQAEGPYYPVVPVTEYDNDLTNLP